MAISDAQRRRVAQERIVELSLSPEQYKEHINRVLTLAREVGRTGKAVAKWYGLHGDDDRAAIYFHTVRMTLSENATDLKERVSD